MRASGATCPPTTDMTKPHGVVLYAVLLSPYLGGDVPGVGDVDLLRGCHDGHAADDLDGETGLSHFRHSRQLGSSGRSGWPRPPGQATLAGAGALWPGCGRAAECGPAQSTGDAPVAK